MEQGENIIPELQENIKLGESLARLRKNKDFKLLITNMFLDEGAKFLTINTTLAKDRDAVMEQLISRSWLYRFLDEIERDAKNSILALEEIISEEEA